MYVCVRLVAVLHLLNVVEARVYCQDTHASPWVPLGHSCPVLCENIINAIERLKVMDFENIIYQKPYKFNVNTIKKDILYSVEKDAINEVDSNSVGKDNTMLRGKVFMHRKRNDANYIKNIIVKSERNKTTINTNQTIDENYFYKDVIKVIQLAAKTFKGRCNKSKKVGLVSLLKCARKSNVDGSFLIIMTKLLNKYVHSVYKFTEEMTEVLLEKIFGENTDLRNNIFDVNKLLKHLRQALHAHKEHEDRDIIALSSKQCLTVSLPGCFCKTGFVESSGQCVKPSDCIQGSLFNEYLARIVIT